MLNWMAQNLGSLVVGGILLVIVGLASWKLYRDKKQHKSSCGCGCHGCPGEGICHKK